MKFKRAFHNAVAATIPRARERRLSDFQLLGSFDSHSTNEGHDSNHQQLSQPPIELRKINRSAIPKVRENESEEEGEVHIEESLVPVPDPFQVYNPTSERLPESTLESSIQMPFSEVRLALREVLEEGMRDRTTDEGDANFAYFRCWSGEPCLSKRGLLRLKILCSIAVLLGCILFGVLLFVSLRGTNGILPHHLNLQSHSHEANSDLFVLKNQQWPLHDAKSRKLNISFDTMARAHKTWNFDKNDTDDTKYEKRKKVKVENDTNASSRIKVNGIIVKENILYESYAIGRKILKDKLRGNNSKLEILSWKGLASSVVIEEIVLRSINSTSFKTKKMSINGVLSNDLCYMNNESFNDNLNFSIDLICNHSQRFRSIDGECNNPIHATQGSQFSPFRIIIDSSDSSHKKWDHITKNVLGGNGTNNESTLLLPKVISREMHGGKTNLDANISALFPFWGMLIFHDTVKVAESPVSCCNYQLNDSFTDKLFDSYTICPRRSVQLNTNGSHELNDDRNKVDSNFHQKEECSSYLTYPVKYPSCELDKTKSSFNLVTSYIDASNVYGSSQERLDKLRLYSQGRLRVTSAKYPTQKGFLPEAKLYKETCFYGNPVNANIRDCYLAGDTDVNDMAVLTSLNTVLMRQHNWLALWLHHHNHHWDDERIFQEARRILIGQIQHITYTEFLPAILGKELMDIGGLTLEEKDCYELYDPAVDASSSDVYAGAVGYFWLSMVGDEAKSIWGRAKIIADESYNINKLFYMPNYLTMHEGNLEALIKGFVSIHSNKIGPEISSRIQALHVKAANKSLNFVQMILQRGRDLNLAPYVEWRKVCGFTEIQTLQELKEIWYSSAFETALNVYKHVSQIDLFTGMLAEKPISGAKVGPTLACLLMDQFLRFKKGDRFWYEGDVYSQHFTAEQLEEIRKTTLARILCDNTNDDLVEVPRWPLLASTEEWTANPHLSCSDSRIPTLNFRLWKERITHKELGVGSQEISDEDEKDEWFSKENSLEQELVKLIWHNS